MGTTTARNLRTIFGIKIKRHREAHHLTLAALAARAGVSTSYLAEIEAGKKSPKAEKTLALADALGVPYDELISSKVDPDFAALQGFLDAPGLRDFPFERFGLPASELVQLLTRSPAEVSALLRALTDIARQYNIGVEHFLHAALRSYQELTGNHYPEIETSAEAFVQELGITPPHSDLPEALLTWVEEELGTAVDQETLGHRPELRRLRAVTLTEPARLLLNPNLAPSQQAFLLAKEIGYRRLNLRARSYVSPPNQEDSFDQVLNDFKASYFAGAVLMPKTAIVADVRRLFRQPRWHPEALLALLERYGVTAENLMYRLSQVVPREFGLRVHFLKFKDEAGQYRLVKQLNLSELPIPPGYGTGEHYCRRWLTTHLLDELAKWQQRHPKRQSHPILGVQVSRFTDAPDEYVCLGLAQPAALAPEENMSLTLGFRADENFYKTVRFARDRTIPHTAISTTCERCPLDATACRERVAPPTLYRIGEAKKVEAAALAELAQEVATA